VLHKTIKEHDDLYKVKINITKHISQLAVNDVNSFLLLNNHVT